MLILTRRLQETIIINDNIEIIFLSVRGNRISIGINAPRDVSVMRGEVLERMNKHKPTKH